MDVIKSQIEKEFGIKISDRQFLDANKRAKKKLSEVIERFGDGNGQRNKPDYLADLIYEDMASVILMELLNMEKEHSVNDQSTPSSTHIVAY